jgi:hypothetical protein
VANSGHTSKPALVRAFFCARIWATAQPSTSTVKLTEKRQDLLLSPIPSFVSTILLNIASEAATKRAKRTEILFRENMLARVKAGSSLTSTLYSEGLYVRNALCRRGIIRLVLFRSGTITHREVQNATKHFCRAPTAQLMLKWFSEAQIGNHWHTIPNFRRVTIQQTFPPERCQQDESKSCRSAKHVTRALAEIGPFTRSLITRLSRFAKFVVQSSLIRYNEARMVWFVSIMVPKAGIKSIKFF